MKLDNVRHFISQATSSRFVALASESMLLLMGPALIVMNLVYFRQWTDSVFMVDADIYYALTALVTLLTMVLLVFTCRRSVRKIKYILCCTVFAVVVLLVVGVVHGSLILSLYRFSLLVRCFQRNTQSSWSVFGYAHQQSVDECQQMWKEYGVFSLLSCIAYVFGAAISLLFVYRYYRKLKRHEKSELTKLVLPKNEFVVSPIEEKPLSSFQEPPDHLGKYSPRIPEEDKPEAEKMVTESYEARQRLYDEITKRKRLEKLYYDPGSPRRSLLFRSPANRYSYLSSHELPAITSSSAPTSPQQLRMDHEFGIYHDNLPSSATLGHHPFGTGAASPSRQSMLLAEHDRYKGWNIPAGYDDSDVQYNTSRMIDHQRLDQLHAQHRELQRQQMPTADQAYEALQSPMSRRTSKSLPRPVPTMIPMPEPPDLSAIDPHALQPPMEIVSPALSDHINPLDSLSPPADALPSSSQHHHPIPGLSHTPISASSARSSSPHQTSDESTPLTSDHQ